VPSLASVANWLASLLRQIVLACWHVGWHVLVFALWLLPPFWDGKHYFYLARFAWAPGLLRIAKSSTTFLGRERVDWNEAHVLVANHQGNADVPLLMILEPRPLRFLTKRSVGRIPILGWMLHLARFPFIDRESARRGRESIQDVARRIREEKMAVAIFPEGTRSPEGTVLPFKTGAFLLAIEAQVPIVPVAIEGSGTVLARGSFRICPAPVTVTVGEPIPTAGLTARDRDALADDAESAIVEMLGWRRIHHTDLPVERVAAEARRLRTLDAPSLHGGRGGEGREQSGASAASSGQG
jgi:1-acyl-sn-glycerol-3-phosphate acyltransferase